MAERFIRLYELPGGLCAPGAPVLIRAGALLWDRRSRNVLAQLKFYNLGPRTVTALTVTLDFPELPGQSVSRSYSDLLAEPDCEFGQEHALLLPNRSVRSFRASISELRFADGGVWQSKGEVCQTLPESKTLAEALGSEEYAERFRARYGRDCVYAPQRLGAFWQCPCGRLNRREEKSCRRCQRIGQAFLAIDLDALRREYELSDAKGEEKMQTQPERKPRERSDAVWIVPLLLLGLLLMLAIVRYAPAVLDSYVPLPVPTDALEALPETTPLTYPIPTPTPSSPPATKPPELLQAEEYAKAVALLDEKHYSEARAAFLALGGYEDSATLAQEAVYRKALELLAFIREHDERDIYALLSMEARGINRFSLSSDKALELGSTAIAALRAACGGDKTDVSFTDAPSGTLRPLAACVKDLFLLLDGYGDSAACLTELAELTDYTRDFYMLCEAGDVYGAYDWLLNYKGEFTGKDNWLSLLNTYKPFCGDWVDYRGDFMLLPLTLEHHDVNCYAFNSRVLIQGDTVTLRLLFTEGDSEYFVDLAAGTRTTDFIYNQHGIVYYATLNNVDHFVYMRYIEGYDTLSVEYQRAG